MIIIHLQKFDCNESDLINIDKPTVINLFRIGSQVYATSQAVYQSSLNTEPSVVVVVVLTITAIKLKLKYLHHFQIRKILKN